MWLNSMSAQRTLNASGNCIELKHKYCFPYGKHGRTLGKKCCSREENEWIRAKNEFYGKRNNEPRRTYWRDARQLL